MLDNSAERDDFCATLVDTLSYRIEPQYLFHTLTNRAKQNILQLNELETSFIQLASHYLQFNGLFDDIDLQSKQLGTDNQQRNPTITEVLKKLDQIDVLGHEGNVMGDAYEFLIVNFPQKPVKKQGSVILSMKFQTSWHELLH